MICIPVIKCSLLIIASVAVSSYSLGPNDVIFHLYTGNNPTISQPLLPSFNSIIMSDFLLHARTVITIHNHGDSVAGDFNSLVVPAHLQSEYVNVIAVDWSAGSAMYSQGLAESAQCGRIVADFVNILINSFGYSAGQIRIVGIGLGGHIAGIAARHINGKVPHIIALDPSLHGWTYHPDRLSADNAEVVEVLHTSAGRLGYDEPLGAIDFYPNGGTYMPGCGKYSNCSHRRAHAFYVESITSNISGGANFIGNRCGRYEDAIILDCAEGSRSAVFGGVAVKTSESGIYTFITNPAPPFAMN